MNMRIFYIMAICAIALLFSCSQRKSKFVYTGEAQGTTYSILYYSFSKQKLMGEIQSVLDSVDRSVNTYKEDSYISRWNRNEVDTVDSLFFDLAKLSMQVWKESDGYFDPTLKPLSEYYGFQGGEKNIIEPMDSILARVGMDKIYFSQSGFVEKTRPDVWLDFNAIAQGYTVDMLKDMLQQEGLDNGFIELGGEITAWGVKPSGGKWTVGIESPVESRDGSMQGVRELIDQSVATSGGYRKYREDGNGEKVIHILGSASGNTHTDILSATVFHTSCAEADAWATALVAMGKKKANDFIRESQLNASLVFDNK